MGGILKSLFGKKDEPAPAGVEAVVEVERAPGSDATPGSEAAPSSEAEPLHVTDDTFDQVVVGASLPALVDFWAPWCGPCRMIAPIVDDLANAYDGRAVIAKMNTDENVDVAAKLGIMGIPTLILFKDGQEADRVVGYAPQHAIEEKLNALMG